MGFGSAWGNEFEPLKDRIKSLTIIEPSDHLKSDKIGNIVPNYVKPELDGTIKFNDGTFDLITCFGTLHHIANASYVLKELIRVLKPNGYLLIREPIISMGDWNQPRPGLTKNERGIPVYTFEKCFREVSVKVVSRNYCLTLMSSTQKLLSKWLTKPIIAYKFYIHLDKFVSSLSKFNYHYHAINKIQRISPSNIFYVIKKNL